MHDRTRVPPLMARSQLGVFEDVSIGRRSVTLEAGDTLVAYADVAIEARRGSAMLGTEGLARVVAAASRGATDLAQAIERSVLQHSGGVISDDLAALVFHVQDAAAGL